MNHSSSTTAADLFQVQSDVFPPASPCACHGDPDQFIAMICEYDRARRLSLDLRWDAPLPITNPVQWTCAGARLHPVVLAIARGDAPLDEPLTNAVVADQLRVQSYTADKPDWANHGPASSLALINGRIFTANPDQPWAEACSIRGDRIFAVGTTNEVLASFGQGQIIDLGGRVVIPGLNDAHMHHTPDPSGVRLQMDESMDPQLDELRAAVTAAVAGTTAGTWIFGTLGITLITSNSLDRDFLDELAPSHPVILLGMTNHTNVLNSAALTAMGIGDDAVNVMGGTLERDPATGRLNGRINEYSQWQPQRAFASMASIDEGAASIKALSADCLRYGVTTIQNMSWTPPERYLKMLEAAATPLRVRVIDFPASGVTKRQAVAPLEVRAKIAAKCGSRVSWSGRKWILDGTPVEYAAAHGAPYVGRETVGSQNFPASEIASMLNESVEDEDQLLLHAIGTAAVRAVVDTLDQDNSGTDWNRRRLRIEHSDGATLEDVQSLRDHGAMIVQNPMHFLLAEMHRLRFGPDHRYAALKSLFDADMPVGIGSDGPLNPYIGVYAAVVHPTRPDERVDVETAISAYTTGSARAEGQDNEKGMLAPGYLADLAVLSQDIFSVDAQSLPGTRSLLTIIGGDVVLNEMPL